MQGWMRRLAIVAVILAVLGGTAFVFLRYRELSPGYVELRTFSDDASGLMDGTQVRLNGIAIGYLETQKLTNSRDLMRKIELDLKVKRAYLDKIPVDSLAGLASDNLLGDLYIAIHRGQSAEHIQAGAELHATLAQDISKMMARMSQQIDRMQAIAERADKLLTGTTAGRGSAGKIINDPKLKQAAGISSQIGVLMGDMQHGHGTIAKLFYEDPMGAQMEAPMKRLDEIMATAGHKSDQLKEVTDGLATVTRDFQTLQSELAAGKGSIGQLDEVRQRFDGLMVKFNAMMDRVNSGQGTAGQLMVNPQLSQALDGAMHEFEELAKGLRANPRKFITLKIF